MANRLNQHAKAHAEVLIKQGKVDESSAWTFEASDEDALLGNPPDWTQYGNWFLGEDDSADSQTKAHWKYPFGKDGQVYRAALRAIASRGAQAGDDDVSKTASALIELIDEQKADDLARTRPQDRRRPRPSAHTRQWYRVSVQAAADGGDAATADVYIYDVIGDWYDGVSSKSLLAAIQALPPAVATLRIHINSPGGDCFEAITIANMLRMHPAAKDVVIEGLCASAATVIACAGDAIRMADNAMYMVHDPWCLAVGDSGDLRQTADWLDKVRTAIVATYQWISPKSADELTALMEAETWMDADEALANGFITEKVSGLKVAAALDRTALASLNVPEKFQSRLEALARPAPVPANGAAAAAEVLRLCAEAQLDLAFAQTLVAENLAADAVAARIGAERTARAAAQTRATDITALCTKAKLPARAALYIKSALSVDDVRADLTTLTAQLDRAEINGGLDPDHGTQARSRINYAAVYGARNKE